MVDWGVIFLEEDFMIRQVVCECESVHITPLIDGYLRRNLGLSGVAPHATVDTIFRLLGLERQIHVRAIHFLEVNRQLLDVWL